MQIFDSEPFMNHGGWFIGNFDPSVVKTEQFEVSYKLHYKNENWTKHHHKIATEVNFLIRGRMSINDIIIGPGKIFVIEKNESVKPIFLEDCELIVVKFPSVKNDKYSDELMNVIRDSLYNKKPSNIDGLSYLPSFKDEYKNDCDWPGQVDPYSTQEYPTQEITDCNKLSISKILNSVSVKNVIEIGVARNGSNSFTHQFLSAKTGKYCGIDIEDKSFLNSQENQVYTIQANSHEQDRIRRFLADCGIDKCSVLMIDGWHSVTTVINDWLYSDLVEQGGVVIFHDTNYHPGPALVVDAIDPKKYRVVKYCQDRHDFGLAAAFKL